MKYYNNCYTERDYDCRGRRDYRDYDYRCESDNQRQCEERALQELELFKKLVYKEIKKLKADQQKTAEEIEKFEKIVFSELKKLKKEFEEEIINLKKEFKLEIELLKADFQKEIDALKKDLQQQIEDAKNVLQAEIDALKKDIEATKDKLPVGNILLNGGFEKYDGKTLPNDWESTLPNSLDRQSTLLNALDVYTGTYAVLLIGDGSNLSQGNIPVVAGVHYELSFAAKNDGTILTPAEVNVRIEFYNEKGVLATTTQVITPNPIVQGGIGAFGYYRMITDAVPEGATYARVVFNVNAINVNTPFTGIIIDDVALVVN